MLDAQEHAHDLARAQAMHLSLQRSLMDWYARERRDLPWRRTRDPYAIWLSEVMLQQTRVDTVVPYYTRFLAAYPTVRALAEAPLDDVLTQWSGLGYYRRARMMHAAAREVSRAGGVFPDTVEGLRRISGIGAYTAGAIASIAFGRRAALVDGNVARVLSRLFALEDDVRAGAGLARLWSLADALVPGAQAGEWNQALMELGATVCVPREPRCLVCPVRDVCEGRARGLERELPHLKAKKKPLVVRRMALVVRNARGEVLFARRRPEGTFGGMWEPPSIDAREDPRGGFATLLGARIAKVASAGEIVHVLSHRKMHVEVLTAAALSVAASRRALKLTKAAEYDALEWAPPDAPRGLTTLARKILKLAARLGDPPSRW